MLKLRVRFPIAFALVTACAAALPGPAAAASPDLKAALAGIQKQIEAKRAAQHVAGAALVVVKDGSVVFAGGFGERDAERGLPVTADTLFAIGSCTKAFTAMTVMMGVEDGRLALDESPRKHLPYFRLRDPDADTRITLADLLCHRSGLDRTDLAWATGRLTSEQIIRVAGQAHATARLGEKFQYQNVMFLAAGEIVGRAYGRPWAAVVRSRIFGPLGMDRSDISAKAMQRDRDHALGYTYDAADDRFAHIPMRDLASIAPAGAINSCAADMGRWVLALLGRGAAGSTRLVSEASFAEMTRPRMAMGGAQSYGLGWMLGSWNGHAIIEHGGNIDGFSAHVAVLPDEAIGMAVLTNANSTPFTTAARDLVFEGLLGKPADAAAPPAGPAADAAPVPPGREAGTYRLAGPNLDFSITWDGARLTLTVAGQPPYPLERVAGRRYRLGSPAPAGFFATFRPAADAPDQAECYLEQPQGNVTLRKVPEAAYKAPITAEELMRREVEALGGERALRRHRTMRVEYAADLETQGLTGDGRIYASAPDAQTDTIVLRALGDPIATIREYFDGTSGGTEISFAPDTRIQGERAADAAVAADFHAPLDWRERFRSVTITGTEKIDGEECYVVRMTPKRGSPVTDYLSTATFLPARRASADGSSETFSDYRTVDGVKVAFARVRTAVGIGTAKLVVRKVSFNVPLPEGAFEARPKATRFGGVYPEAWR